MHHKRDHTGELEFLYTLLREMCNISPHKNGWGNPPESKDNCAAACIERIKIKNEEMTSQTAGFSTPMFQDNWNNLRNDIIEIEQQILEGHLYKQRTDNLFSTDICIVNFWVSRIKQTLYVKPGKTFLNKQ